jgi:hypothetical protein
VFEEEKALSISWGPALGFPVLYPVFHGKNPICPRKKRYFPTLYRESEPISIVKL